MTEQKEPDLIYAVFPDGTYSKRETLQEAASIPNVELIVVGKYHHTYPAQKNPIPWYHWKLKDLHGNSTTLKRGDFEMVAVDLDRGYVNIIGRKIVFRDCRKNTYFDFESQKWGVDFIKEEVLPLLDKLNELGSWEAYVQIAQQKKNIGILMRDNERLQNEINALQEKIRQLSPNNQ